MRLKQSSSNLGCRLVNVGCCGTIALVLARNDLRRIPSTAGRYFSTVCGNVVEISHVL